MKNPLRKRLLRELRQEAGKYLAIFLLLVATIGFVSGFLVADGSLIAAYNESFEKYNIEDGNFRTAKQINKAQEKAIEALDVTLYENFYVEEQLTNDSKLRIFQNREQVNRICLMEGNMPQRTDEIAIDRMYADNNGVSIGDTLESASRSWTVTGLVALSDYSCLFENNSDSMFDAKKFGVAVVTAEAFAGFDTDELSYSYSWKYNDPPADETEENSVAEDFMKALSSEVSLEDFIPQYQNQAIQFSGNDMGSDRGMMIMLLYIVIAIMAFVFSITTSNTIAKEANVIGTLRASGYTKNELVRHYMTMPMLVTAISAVIGNIIGYTVMKDYCAGMYYGSYSLPTYVTRWNGEAFVMTTVVPVIMMVVINVLILEYKLQLSPLKFLRRDLRRRKQKRALRLPTGIPFFHRFRLRVIFQNMGNYVVLLVGIVFANLLLIFGLALPDVLDIYQDNLKNNMLSEYQYLLQMPYDAMNDEHKLESMISMLLFENEVQTDNADAEKFSAYSLKTVDTGYDSEDIMIYGVKEDSRYVQLEHADTGVSVSSTYADKYDIRIGDTIALKEPYADTRYTLTVSGIYDYQGALAVFMDQTEMNRMLDYDDDYFSGYFSDTEITDIDEAYIGSVVDLDALTKISRQLDISMGSMMFLIDGFAVGIFMVLIYLLSKTIIEKNAQSISMTKILGYSNREISSLYIISTTIVVVLCILISFPVEAELVDRLFRMILKQELTGWIPLIIRNVIYVKMFVIGVVTYAVVALLEYRRIRRVPMDAALKNVE